MLLSSRPYPRATSSIMLTMSRAAFGRARLRAAHDWRSISPGWSRREKISLLRRSGVSSGSGITRPAPARTISWALRNWWLSVACPKGMKMAARPEAAISAAVIAPARQTMTSAQEKRSAIFDRKGTTSAGYSRRAAVHGVDDRAIDRQRALAAAGYEQMKWFLRRARRDREEFGTHGAAGDHRFRAPRARGNVVAGGDAPGDLCQHTIGEARLGVGLENHIGHAAQPRGEHHRACRVASDSEGRDGFVLAEHAERVGKTWAEHRQILQ